MKAQLKFFGKVIGGKFIPHDPVNFRKSFERYKDGDEIFVTHSKKVKQRTLDQNKYLWGVPYSLIAIETGMDLEEVHEAMKIKFLRIKRGEIWTVRSTSQLGTMEFYEYTEKIIKWAAEYLNVIVPPPEKVQL